MKKYQTLVTSVIFSHFSCGILPHFAASPVVTVTAVQDQQLLMELSDEERRDEIMNRLGLEPQTYDPSGNPWIN